jgi:DNA repair and recombination protein RAD54B
VVSPPDHSTAEYVVFITPTETQLNMFAKMLANDQLDDLVSGSTADSLALINHLTKISSSPILLKAKSDSIQHKANATTQDRLIMEAAKLLPSNLQIYDVSLSGKYISLPLIAYHVFNGGLGKLTALASLLKVLRRVCARACTMTSL